MPAELFSQLKSLEQNFAGQGIEKFRARQVLNWVFEKRATSFDDMTDLSLALRKKLNEAYQLFDSTISMTEQSADGTEKLLVQLKDAQQVECVLLRDGQRRSICVQQPSRMCNGLRFLCQRFGRR